jgi:hypothetical protein
MARAISILATTSARPRTRSFRAPRPRLPDEGEPDEVRLLGQGEVQVLQVLRVRLEAERFPEGMLIPLLLLRSPPRITSKTGPVPSVPVQTSSRRPSSRRTWSPRVHVVGQVG